MLHTNCLRKLSNIAVTKIMFFPLKIALYLYPNSMKL